MPEICQHPRSAPRRPRTIRARRRVAVAASALLLGALAPLVTAGQAHAGLTTGRDCETRTEGNFRLDFCARGWVDAGNDHTRGVVEMHTYRWVGGGVPGGWVDSTSQSITLNFAWMENTRGRSYSWGNGSGNGTRTDEACRVNGPAGRVACSVASTSRVAFYSPDNPADGWAHKTAVYDVSFRDANGVAHRFFADLPQAQWSWSA